MGILLVGKFIFRHICDVIKTQKSRDACNQLVLKSWIIQKSALVFAIRSFGAFPIARLKFAAVPILSPYCFETG